MTLASNLRENKAVYAVAGAGDFAVQKLREMPEQMTRYRETATKYQGEVRETVDRYRVQVLGTVDRYRGEVSRYQERVDAKDLPGAAVAYATHVGTLAFELFEELAERGKKVVHREAVEVAEITDTKPAPKPRAAAQKRNGTRTRSTTKKNGA
ncbi:hypothetical protein E1264_35830 [Actinomadura sp. KC216]|uniref:hypothetical protein n=1 Tax=Actinomadura sp. KC216 TaxID=2530370 RepID=UPI0010445740|nr:hypothetical protein [Actinomadura sp. KC216]TDB79206.1 hypothetical protein E1264_35830 [Actinomadura sp. KC216]